MDRGCCDPYGTLVELVEYEEICFYKLGTIAAGRDAWSPHALPLALRSVIDGGRLVRCRLLRRFRFQYLHCFDMHTALAVIAWCALSRAKYQRPLLSCARGSRSETHYYLRRSLARTMWRFDVFHAARRNTMQELPVSNIETLSLANDQQQW